MVMGGLGTEGSHESVIIGPKEESQPPGAGSGCCHGQTDSPDSLKKAALVVLGPGASRGRHENSASQGKMVQ